MASLSTCHLGLWLGWQILLNLKSDEIKCPGGGGCDNIINPGHSVRKAVKEQPFEFNRVTELSSR